MRYGWDETKRRRNLKHHGIDFTAVYRFEWDLAVRRVDHREDYGELREQAIRFVGARLHVLIFTERLDEDGDLIWVISLRKAEAPEKRTYERATKKQTR
jgi:uncharacterized DUF497 family protein